MKKSNLEKAISYGRRLLNIRLRSGKELEERLLRKGFGQSDTKEALSYFRQKNLLDDLEFARAWVESRMRSNPRGAMLLERELLEKGISRSITQKVLLAMKDKEKTLAESLAESRMRGLRNLPRQKAKRRLFEYLARRGFKFDTIDDIVNSYFHED